jgi:hypothetical protein
LARISVQKKLKLTNSATHPKGSLERASFKTALFGHYAA